MNETWLDRNGGKIVIGVFAVVQILGLVTMFYPLQDAYIGWQLYTAPMWSKILTIALLATFWIYCKKLADSDVDFGMGTGFLLLALFAGGFAIAASTGEYREEVPAQIESK
jgi:membrane protease YdiL (CAAX protease family)